MRLIDADALHDDLKAKQKWIVKREDKHNEGYTYDQVHFAIDDQPTVDAVSVRHARLVNAQPYGECSCCGELIDSRDRFRYCPYCGARLDGDKHGTD